LGEHRPLRRRSATAHRDTRVDANGDANVHAYANANANRDANVDADVESHADADADAQRKRDAWRSAQAWEQCEPVAATAEEPGVVEPEASRLDHSIERSDLGCGAYRC
jgi:hypothetical protein